uniref:Thioredoxin domain-containing protein n=1 Tax=Panagrolaimus davidi TaxID=227884 RepID=A0A914NY12_9BILA
MDPEKFDEELEENLEAFMKVISSGKAKPYVKSQPAPKNDKGPVKTLVAANFDKIVNDESKDQFEPKYAQLAAKLKSEQPNLILAKFDATANDAPQNFNVEGFPTIFFAPSGKKSTPVKYSGNRDLDHLTEFMKKNAVKSFQKKEEL